MSIKLNAQSGGSVALDAPTQTTSSADLTFKLPVADGSADQVLKTDGSGNFGFVAQSIAGISMMDQWRITNDNNKTNGQVIDSNWERTDTFFAQIGTGMSESSGIFTFPQTGIYLLMCQSQLGGNASYAGIALQASSDSGSNYSSVTEGYQNCSTVGGYHHVTVHGIVDVTNASTFRVRLEAVNSASTQYSGSSNYLRNGITFIRIGDT